jgi:hypothetical protein
MKRHIATILRNKAFIVGFAFSVAASFTHAASAWTRTISSGQRVEGIIAIGFTSDGISGTPNGNSAGNVYVDILVTGNNSSAWATVQVEECGTSFNGTNGGCGGQVTNNYQKGDYDIWMPKWSGTGSAWDYFYVSVGVLGGSPDAEVFTYGISWSGT